MPLVANKIAKQHQKSTAETTEATSTGQEKVVDETSVPNIVQTASGSKDHTTLVTAVKAADLVRSLSNAGPFTVFAPTNAAFDKFPAGTVEGLLKPEKKGDLENILGYHTYVGTLKTEYMQDGQEFDMVFGGKVKITKKEDKTFVNGSEIVASIPTCNGIIHVIGDVFSKIKLLIHSYSIIRKKRVLTNSRFFYLALVIELAQCFMHHCSSNICGSLFDFVRFCSFKQFINCLHQTRFIPMLKMIVLPHFFYVILREPPLDFRS